jgi:glycosyltransferase involved in cell wall biosynthesis
MKNKLKILWICQFSNPFIRSQLPLSEYYNHIDYSQWITQMINQFKNFNDIELHIISSHSGLKTKEYTFQCENVHYYFFRDSIAVFKSKFLQKWGFRLNKILLYKPDRYSVKRLIKKHIQFTPDIVNLIGFENPVVAPGILNIKNIPKLITVQGIYSNPERFKNQKEDKIKSFLERSVIKRNKYYCIGASFFSELILRDRKDAIFLGNFFPRDIPEMPTDQIQKEYDFVFFARVTQVKGIEDLIEAMALVKQVKADVSLIVMGAGDLSYISFLKEKTSDLGLNSNITFLGEQKTMVELHKQALKARFYVLPTRLEGLAGSVLECMYMGLPVVTTNAGGMPYLNKDDETVLMTNPFDVPAFANNMIRLVKEPELGDQLIVAARAFVEKEFNHHKICRKFVEQYHAVINHYHSGEDIPHELLFKLQADHE